jgi:predicted RNase H-related nuclease YkuK (DUF458 family)
VQDGDSAAGSLGTGWVSLGGKRIDSIEEVILLRQQEDKYSFHVGTDSKEYKSHTIMTTAICFREFGHGALVAYRRYKIDNFNSMSERLIHETVVSLRTAILVQGLTNEPPTVNADVNPQPEALSNRVHSAIIGMVTGMGFSCTVKPNAWAADIADMFTRR